MTTLTAAQLLGIHPRPSSSADARRAGSLHPLAHRLVAALRRRQVARRLAALPDHLLRDIGLDGVDLDALDRAH